MSIDWTPLRRELSAWRAQSRPLPIWWRDDDAVQATPALERLAALSDILGLKVHLAVIPAHAQGGLARFAADHRMIPVVHGWAHENHSPEGEKKAEFGHPRETAENDMASALHRMETLFGSDLLPMFVPPWNRCAPEYEPTLQHLGYLALSTFTPRPMHPQGSGLIRINTHIDPIAWRGSRGLVDPDTLIAQVVANLVDRRTGQSDASEPLGYLTHHLVHDEEIWTFSHNLLSELLEGGATPADIKTLISEEP